MPIKNRYDLLIERICKLPPDEIETYARMYEKRALETPNARFNVSAKIAVALRLHLDNHARSNPSGKVLQNPS